MILKGAEHVAIGQADVGVRVHVAVEVSVRGDEGGVERMAEIEEIRAATFEGVGKEETVLGHLEFGVMRRASRAGSNDGGDSLAVVGRRRVGIEDGEEVVALFGVVARPDVEVGVGLGLEES
jgi:hypothetical protein